MPIYDMYPYSNLHELNLDWLIKEVEECKSDVADVLSTVTSLSDAFTVDDQNQTVTANYTLIAADIQGVATSAYQLLTIADNPYYIGSTSEPCYFSNGKPVQCGSSLDADITGNAAGAESVVDSNGDPLTAGTNRKPVYINAGVPTQCEDTLQVSITGTAAFAECMVDIDGVTLEVGGNSTPIYFHNGVPYACSTPYTPIKKLIVTPRTGLNAWTADTSGIMSLPHVVELTELVTDHTPSTFNINNAIFVGGYISAGNSNNTIAFLSAGISANGSKISLSVGLTYDYDPDDIKDLGVTLYYIDKV